MRPASTCLAVMAALMLAATSAATGQTGAQGTPKPRPSANAPAASDAARPKAAAPEPKAKGSSAAETGTETKPGRDADAAEADEAEIYRPQPVQAAPEDIGASGPRYRPAIQRGLLGASVLADALALAITLFLGALLGGLLGARRAGRQARRLFGQHEMRIAVIEKGLNAQMKLSQSLEGLAPQPTRPQPYGSPEPYGRSEPYGRPATYGMESERPDFPAAPAPRRDPAPAPDPARRAALERSRQLNQAIDDYCRLVATKGARPRQFAELLSVFPKLLSVRIDAGTIIGESYREGDANQILVAAGDGEHFAVLPTYEYVSDFSMAFSKLVMTPPIVSQLFDLVEDESGQVQLVQAATVEKDGDSLLRLTSKGRLSGFRS